MINIPKGTKDVLPADSYKWQIVRQYAQNVAQKYNIKEIITPTFEHTELFVRGVGKGSDIVNKEMYTFMDKGNRSITLKPEGTASVVRSFVENGLFNDTLPLKLYYITSCFRYERPQEGRLREHHQFGVELFGADGNLANLEAITIALDFYKQFGIEPTLEINNLGCEECKRNYIAKLKDYFKPHLNQLCEDCQTRYNNNPLRILDCKVGSCRKIIEQAPKLRECLCDSCKIEFDKLLDLLKLNNIKYKVNDYLVRGLDYYTNVVFEFVDNDYKQGFALGAGGRYNNLVAELGGKHTPVVGFGIGIERLLMYLQEKNIKLVDPANVDVYVVSMLDDKSAIIKLVKQLRDNNIKTDYDLCNRSMKAQLKYANKINAKYVIILGEEEYQNNTYTVKDMSNATQKTVNQEDILNYLKGDSND